jgi:hypothetical protein
MTKCVDSPPPSSNQPSDRTRIFGLPVVVEGNGVTNDKSIWVADATEILLSLTTVKNVMVSMNEDWWEWSGDVSAG